MTHLLLSAFSLMLLLASAINLDGAQLNPVHWTVDRPPSDQTTNGAPFNVTLHARVESGWHIYALDEPEGGPLPTEIGLSEGDSLSLLGVHQPAPHMVPDPVLHQLTGTFEKDVAFTLTFRLLKRSLPPGPIGHILIRYQACSDKVCLPPRIETVPLPRTWVVR